MQEYIYKSTNREIKRAPRKQWAWCNNCDAARVSDGSKCPVCKTRRPPKRDKK